MDAKEKESGQPRPSARIKFNEGCVLIAAFVLALPAMILLLIALIFERIALIFEGEGKQFK